MILLPVLHPQPQHELMNMLNAGIRAIRLQFAVIRTPRAIVNSHLPPTNASSTSVTSVPSYQPGHAHADTFNFVLNIHNEPLIVDTGISTYEANETRLKERGTAAHNTVTVSG